MSYCGDEDCLPNRLLAKVIGELMPENHGMCIHLDDNKYVVSNFKGKIRVEDANDYDYEDYQPLEVADEIKVN